MLELKAAAAAAAWGTHARRILSDGDALPGSCHTLRERERESERGECATRLEAKGKHKTDVFQGKAKGGCAEDGLWQAKAQQ